MKQRLQHVFQDAAVEKNQKSYQRRHRVGFQNEKWFQKQATLAMSFLQHFPKSVIQDDYFVFEQR